MVYLALPIQNGGSFHGKLLNNQRVHHFSHIHMISWLSHGRKHMGSERQRREVLVPMAGLLPAPVLPGWDGQFMSIWDPSINILMGKMGIIWGWTNSAINLGFDDLNPPICSLWKPPKRRTAHAGTASRRKKRALMNEGQNRREFLMGQSFCGLTGRRAQKSRNHQGRKNFSTYRVNGSSREFAAVLSWIPQISFVDDTIRKNGL